jgi:Fe-S oxidoreductase
VSPLAGTYFSVPEQVIFWLLFIAALGFFIQRLYVLVRLLKLGRTENRSDRYFYRFTNMLAVTLVQWCSLKSVNRKDITGIGHAFMFWGLGIFLTGYVVFIGLGAGVGLYPLFNGSGFETVFFSILDIAGLFIIIAMVWVIIKRYVIKPERLERNETNAEKIMQPMLIATIISLMLLYYLIEGFGYAAYGIAGSWPPVGQALAKSWINGGISQHSLIVVHKGLWWFNYIILLGVLIYTPRSKHLHPLFSFPNIFFKNLAHKGSLRPIDLQKPETYQVFKVSDFTWKEILDSYACTWCGRCHTICPAQLTGKPLSPRELVLNIKERLLRTGPDLLKNKMPMVASIAGEKTGAEPGGSIINKDNTLIDEIISEDGIWSCTTCLACQEVCPSECEQMVKITDLRRHLQLGAMTTTARDTLKNLRTRGHPWRGSIYARTDWADAMDITLIENNSNVDILFWVGCTGALEDRSLKVTQAFARLMKQAGVNFGILGGEELCCGDPARRLGGEHLFQMVAMQNIRLFSSYNIKKIVTACPHCFNTIKNEYQQFGGHFEVLHHTQLIADLFKDNSLKIKRSEEVKATYQDPCYLGRYNDIYKTPRKILKNIPGMTLIEMENNHKDSFCCGGGGGRMWLEEKIGQRINEVRLNQALGTKAELIATACPFCLQMLEDAARVKSMDGILKIRDIAELVMESL